MMTDADKWALLQAIPARDAQHPYIRRIANALKEWSKVSGPNAQARSDVRFARLAMAIARDGIEYMSDTAQFGGEDIAGITRFPDPDDAIDAWVRGIDDCDAKARLFVALALAAGYQARIWPLWEGDCLKHVAAEIYINGRWHHVETILGRARFGEMHTEVPKEASTGKWLLT